MPSLTQIYTQQSRYVRRSGITVTVDTSQGTVAIDAGNGEGVFLQGDEASDFIDTARGAYEACGDITMDIAYEATAYPYASLIECC